MRTQLVTIGAALAALSACSASRHHSAPTTQPRLPTPTSTRTLSNGPAVPLAVPNVPTDRHNVAIGTCAGDKTSWHASGSAANSTAAPVTYQVTVFFTSSRATVLGFASTKVVTAAHKQATWSVTSKFANSGSLRCVLRGVAVVR